MIMQKFFRNFSAPALTLSLIFALGLYIVPNTAEAAGACFNARGERITAATITTRAQCEALGAGAYWDDNAPSTTPNTASTSPNTSTSWWTVLNPLTWLTTALGSLSIVILQLASFLTYLSGVVLNFVIQYTVVDMTASFDEIGEINTIWTTVRDLGNMGFIFILLYAAIMTIVGKGQDNKQLIVRIVVVAVLINFSLFFTKIVIDLANLLAITFYDAIAPGALSSGISRGLSQSMMEPLNIESIWNAKAGLSGDNLLVIGIMGTIVSLIAAFVFFAVAILFVIRFVVLIFVLALSPIAFLAQVFPELKKYGQQWLDALVGQAFFAPIYFFLTWIVIVISRGLPTHPGGSMAAALNGIVTNGEKLPPDPSSLGLLMNFLIIIALLITSLVVAKTWANKAPGVVGQATKWANGFASDKAFGGLGALGRKTIGRGGEALTNNAELQKAAREKTGFAGARARMALYAGQKARSGTFDVRNATIPTNTIGAAIEGTIGRTGIGKKMGLDEVRIPSIPVGSIAADQTDVGKGGTKGFRELTEEKAKRIEAREKAAATEYRQVTAHADVSKGASTGATAIEIAAMEKSLAKMSEKEVEAIVDSNRELLKSQNFANALSVKQLEALNKSDKLSDDEKDHLKDSRFTNINVAMATGGAGAAAAAADIKALTDSELEMINPTYLNDSGFVSQLRGGQVEAINKSNKFTRAQKGDVRVKRREPLDTAIAAVNAVAAQNELRKFSPKDIVAMGMGLISNPLLLPNPAAPDGAYTPNMLKRMAQEMNTADIQTLRTALLATLPPLPNETRKWLEDPNTGAIDFS
jgi:hypothetical protein